MSTRTIRTAGEGGTSQQTARETLWLSAGNGTQQGRHDRRQSLPVCQTGTDEQAEAPETLRLGCTSPGRRTTIECNPELTLKLVLKVTVMLGGAQ